MSVKSFAEDCKCCHMHTLNLYICKLNLNQKLQCHGCGLPVLMKLSCEWASHQLLMWTSTTFCVVRKRSLKSCLQISFSMNIEWFSPGFIHVDFNSTQTTALPTFELNRNSFKLYLILAFYFVVGANYYWSIAIIAIIVN